MRKKTDFYQRNMTTQGKIIAEYIFLKGKRIYEQILGLEN